MKVGHFQHIEEQEILDSGATGVTIRWLISKETADVNFAMRFFEIEPGGHTPYHTHDNEHEVFVISGKGAIVNGMGNELPLTPGSFVYVKPGEKHQFKNCGDTVFQFICVIPV